jgi:hypothetical protein
MAGAEDCCFAASIPAFRGRGAPANEDSPKSIFRIFLVRAQDLIGRGVTSKIYAKEASWTAAWPSKEQAADCPP